MLPRRGVYCAGADLVYVMLYMTLSILRQKGNNAQKVFTKCYQLLVGWMHPIYGEGDPELTWLYFASSHLRLVLLAAEKLLLKARWVVFVWPACHRTAVNLVAVWDPITTQGDRDTFPECFPSAALEASKASLAKSLSGVL